MVKPRSSPDSLECMTRPVDLLMLFTGGGNYSNLLCTPQKTNSTRAREIFVGLHLRYVFKLQNKV